MTTPERDFLGTWFGTMTLGDTVPDAEAQVLITEALDAGIRKFDTANVYADGRSEEILGQTLGNRDDIVIASKVGLQKPAPGQTGPLSGQEIRRSITASLKRLQRDRLDLLILHAPDRATHPEETATALRDAQSEGLVAKFGLSNFSSWQTVHVT